MKSQNANAELEIDILHLIRQLWQKAWIIIISMVICGAMAFSYSALFIAPQYKSRAMMYVNNSSLSFGGTSLTISASELSAAKSLLEIYLIILESRTTLEKVIEEAGLDCSYQQLAAMVYAAPVNGTEVFEVVATSSDPAEAELIVDTITHVLPDRISEIVDGSSVRIVDTAVKPTSKSSPNNTRNGLLGVIFGAVISCAAIVILDLLNTTVRDAAYLTEKYQIPILASIPDMYAKSSGKNQYYSEYYREKKTTDTENSSVQS